MSKFIAFYLPQFYPFPENDEWWGKGFTEWTNVTKARPQFAGHYQPHLPTDLGFYDLRVRETHHEQVRMAKSYGIDGFCYHYYWFSGKRLLDEPLEDMLRDASSDMPFCLNWANEGWTRRWDGKEDDVLIAQKYLPDDDLRLMDDVCRYFADSRYITIGGAPFFMVYRPQQLPDYRKSIELWRRRAAQNGFPDLHLCCALTHGNMSLLAGFDSGVEFPPHNLSGVRQFSAHHANSDFLGQIFEYTDIAAIYMARDYGGAPVLRTVFPSWDNTARLGNRARIVINSTPRNYEYWLGQAAAKSDGRLPYVFINAWNEWAEGCHLEPDRYNGREFLEATKRVSDGTSAVERFEYPFDTGSRFRRSKIAREANRIVRQVRQFPARFRAREG
jgi:lipopolysaccharide biosynthesis protein